MDSKETKNFRIHHCRRDLNDAAVIIMKNLNSSRFDDLRNAITDSEIMFVRSAHNYPPLPDFNMPQNYFDGNWDRFKSVESDENAALGKVRKSIEKAIRRSDKFLSDPEFSKQRYSLQKILAIINPL